MQQLCLEGPYGTNTPQLTGNLSAEVVYRSETRNPQHPPKKSIFLCGLPVKIRIVPAVLNLELAWLFWLGVSQEIMERCHSSKYRKEMRYPVQVGPIYELLLCVCLLSGRC